MKLSDIIKVAVYCRVSTEKYEQYESLQNQIEYFTNYINDSYNYEIYEIYAENGVTGTSVDKRIQFCKMMKDASDGKFNTILTKEISRFARNTLDAIKFTRELKKIGVNVIFINDGIDTKDPDSEIRLAILSSLAQDESRRTSERVKFGQKIKMQNGVVFGHSLFGYIVKDGKIYINEKEAEIVKLIFDLYVNESMSVSEISKYLIDNKKCVSSYMKKWSPTAVLRILKNEKYCGDLIQRKSITTDYLSHKRTNNNGDKIIIPNHHKPIIDKKTFDMAQQILLKNKKNTTKTYFDTSIPTSVSKPLSSE